VPWAVILTIPVHASCTIKINLSLDFSGSFETHYNYNWCRAHSLMSCRLLVSFSVKAKGGWCSNLMPGGITDSLLQSQCGAIRVLWDFPLPGSSFPTLFRLLFVEREGPNNFKLELNRGGK